MQCAPINNAGLINCSITNVVVVDIIVTSGNVIVIVVLIIKIIFKVIIITCSSYSFAKAFFGWLRR